MPGNEQHRRLQRIPEKPGRTADYLALDILRRRGYMAVRSSGPNPLVQLIAWQGKDLPIFIRVKRSRRPISRARDVLIRWRDEVVNLQELLVHGATVQFWILSRQRGWQVYEICQGGIREVS